MSETFTTKPKLESGTIRGWLVLIVPFISSILRMSGVELPDNLETDLVTNIMHIVDSILYLVGLVMVFKGRSEASKPLTGGLFSGWRR